MKEESNKLRRANELLRRIYDVIEMSHLNDHKLSPHYCEHFGIKRSLGEGIFNYLQSSDEVFKNTVIKIQKRYRNYLKKKNIKKEIN